MGTHDVVCDTFVAITQNVNFHLRQEQLHALLSTMFNSSYQEVDIVLTKDGICILINIVIVDPTQMDLLPQSCATQRFVTFDVTQAKERNYRNQHPIDQFFLSIIKVFGCLHKQIDVF
jgi:hypothetical protein